MMTGTVITGILARLADIAGLPVTHTRRARVEGVRDEAPGVRTLVLRPERGWRPHRPGQHVQIGVAIDGRIATRTYSISSAPDARRFEITVKAQGRASSHLATRVEVGTFLSIGAATGDFVAGDESPLLFVTAGSGITPIASMVRSFERMPDVVHVHFARTPEDFIFGEELRALAVHQPSYRLVVIHTASDRRRLDTSLLDTFAHDWRDREAFACGPQAMLEAATACIPGVKIERFQAPLPPRPANSNSELRHRVRVRGLDVLADDHTPLLHVAEAAGQAPPHGCRMGICHTCDVTLVSGCVRDLRTNTTIDQPGAKVQICVCAAASDVEVSS